MKRLLPLLTPLALLLSLFLAPSASAMRETYYFMSTPGSPYNGQSVTLDDIPITYNIFSSTPSNLFYSYAICPYVYDDSGHTKLLPLSYCHSFYMNGNNNGQYYTNTLSGTALLYFPGINNISCIIVSSADPDAYQDCGSPIRVNHVVTGNPVYRMANWQTHERLFTTNWSEAINNDGNNGWVYEQVAFKAPEGPDTGIAVYRLANWQTKERLFTTDWNEVQAIKDKNGWVHEGTAFYASYSGAPVYRMANWKTHERLFTTDWNEVQSIKDANGWVYESLAFYAG